MALTLAGTTSRTNCSLISFQVAHLITMSTLCNTLKTCWDWLTSSLTSINKECVLMLVLSLSIKDKHNKENWGNSTCQGFSHTQFKFSLILSWLQVRMEIALKQLMCSDLCTKAIKNWHRLSVNQKWIRITRHGASCRKLLLVSLGKNMT